MGERLAIADGGGSGPPGGWPDGLRSVATQVLESRLAMAVARSTDGILLYNGRYAEIIGTAGQGKKAIEAHGELWRELGPLYDHALGGRACGCDRRPVAIDRGRGREECYFDFSIAPVREEGGRVAGVIITAVESTERVLAARRMRTLRELAGAAETDSVSLAWRRAAEALALDAHDLPFSCLYEIEPTGESARLTAVTGVVLGHRAAAEYIALDGTVSSPFDDVVRGARSRVIRGLTERYGAIPSIVWPEPVETAVVLPIGRRGSGDPAGILVAGVSPRRPLDEGYAGFLELVAAQITAAVSSAGARQEAVRAWEPPPDGLERPSNQELRGKLALAIEATGLGTWSWDPGRDVVECSLRTREMLGIAAGVPVTMAVFLDRAHSSDRKRVRRAIDRALGGYGDLSVEYRTTWPAERSIRAVARVLGGKLVGTVADLTARRAIAAERRDLLRREQEARREAEAANRAKDEFMALLGHELRNPLAPILTAIELMKIKRAGADHEQEVIERQVKHMVRLVDDLLDVSRITRGKIELHREAIELAPVVARAVEMASPLLEARAHHLAIDVQPTGLAIDGDALRLAQVLANLINNSARYTPPDGHITVRAMRDADRIRISVRDDGPGIEPDMLERIFEPFTQADRPPGAGSGGLGLGLPLARSIAALHGGTVVAKSEGKGTGTEVVVELPALHPARTVRPPMRDRRDSPWVAAGNARILIVDDNQDAAELLAMGFEALGYEVRIAGDGPRALEIAVSFRPRACAIDIGLPVMDGYEVGERLRAILGAEVRLVAVSGYGQTRDREKSLESGFVEHLVKPVDLATLARALHPA